MLFPSPSPGPNWEALQEPEPSSYDELDTEDGEVNTPGSAHLNTQKARDGRKEATRDPPLSSPPAFASTSTNPIIGDSSRSQMKRKESESLFTSKKRVRYFPAAHSDQDDAIDLDLDEHAKYKRHTGINSKPAPEQKTKDGLGGWQPGASLSASSTTMNKFGNDSTPVHAKLSLMKKSSGKRPPFPNKRLSESAVESIRPATSDPPSKLAGLPFDAYKRAGSRTVPASDPRRSIVSASPVGVNPFGINHSKAFLKRRRLPSAPQTTRYFSKTKAIPSDAEVIEISSDDDSPPSSISLAKSKSKSIKPSFETLSAPAQARQGSRTAKIASGSASSSAVKKFLPKAPVEVIEILDSDDEQLPSKAQLLEKNVGRSSSGRLSELLQECATGSNPRRDQSRHISSLGGDSFEGSDRYSDVMDIDGGDPLDIPSSPRALSQELPATDDANDNQGTQGSIPLPSSSPSSVCLSPKDNHLSTPPASTSSRASLAMSSPLQQSFTLPTKPNSSKKPTTAGTSSSSNRLGFSSVAVPSSLQAPPPANNHRRQFARKVAPRSISYKDEDGGESNSEPEGTANTKANKGKEKEIQESSSSSSGTESINMRGLQDALVIDSDTLKQRPVSPTSSKKQGQTLAEAIISAGQLNSTKKTRRRLQKNAKDVPVDHTSDVEAGIKDGSTADENEKALKAAIGSSRLLVNLLPALKGKGSVSAAAAAGKVTESPASSPQGKKLSLSPTRTQDSHTKIVPPESPSIKDERSSYPLSTLSPNPNIMAHNVPSQKPLLSLKMKLETESSAGTIFGAAVQPKTEPTTAFEFKSGTAVIEPPKTADLEAIQTPNTPPLSIHPPASSIVPTSFNDAVQDGSFDTLGLPSDDSPDGDEKECQALLQGPNSMDVIPSHDVQSLQDSIVVRHKPHINLDTSIAAPSPLKSLSTTTEVFNEHTSVSPPIPEVSTRRSSRLSSHRSSHHSSSRSSRSPSSGGLGTTFDFDFGPSNSVPVSRTSTPEVQDLSASSLPSLAMTYGGFRALTWKDFRKDLNNFTPKTYYAKDLPHDLQDHINSMSEYTQMMGGMRDLFKATILENTVEDEPDAPPIEIWNSVDTQSTPPWEFYYTNNMWLGEGVPPPDIKTLLSCTCKGGCNPKSKTCACLLRQREATGDPLLEFAYDKNGKLKIPGYPIFECNDLCGCSDECRNRVVQQGRKVSVNIGKTETKGWGVFAGSKKIPEGTYIGIYSGELLTDAEAHERGIKYNKSGRTYLFDIDFHHLKEGNSLWENFFTVDAYHAGNFTRFLNHSCDPNCRLYACYINEGNIQKPLLAIFSRRDIEPFEEICFNYQGLYDDGDEDDDDEGDDNKILDPDHQKDMIYVRCRCGAKNCTGTMFK